MGIAEATRRLLAWLRQGLDEPDGDIEVFGGSELPDAQSDAVEWPWRYRWDHLPKRSAGFGFSGRDYDAARARAEEIARLTLGDRKTALELLKSYLARKPEHREGLGKDAAWWWREIRRDPEFQRLISTGQ